MTTTQEKPRISSAKMPEFMAYCDEQKVDYANDVQYERAIRDFTKLQEGDPADPPDVDELGPAEADKKKAWIAAGKPMCTRCKKNWVPTKNHELCGACLKADGDKLSAQYASLRAAELYGDDAEYARLDRSPLADAHGNVDLEWTGTGWRKRPERKPSADDMDLPELRLTEKDMPEFVRWLEEAKIDVWDSHAYEYAVRKFLDMKAVEMRERHQRAIADAVVRKGQDAATAGHGPAARTIRR